MIEGLKLTFSGEELRTLLEARINHHGACADRWTSEQRRSDDEARAPGEETDDAPLLPEQMCEHEAERHGWRASVLQFICDHLEPAETYRLCSADLEIAELLPARPESLEQEEYEERTRVGFTLERLVKAVETVRAGALFESHWHGSQESKDPPATDVVEDTVEFRTTRLDLRDGPEIVMIERK